jgi:LmbE family N-acetylglucosaminyl deacetylase
VTWFAFQGIKNRMRNVAGVAVLLACFFAATVAQGAEQLVVPPKLRLLVVAPHPDDESLGAGGLIQQTLAGGGRVHVLFMTNGDGYPEAVTMATSHHEPTAADYRGFGELRRAEALVALERYRVLPLSVTFLGFPDGGLAEIWRRGPHVPPYESPFTREDNPPYPEAYDPRARYVSRDLITLIARLIAVADPDWIVVPAATDNHADHCASFTFVLAALHSLANEPGGQSKIPDRLLTYVVHAGNWPPPPKVPGLMPDPPKLPPGARWMSLPLGQDQVLAKLGALESHHTQAAVMDGLFRSFARPNEVFGVIDKGEIARLTPGTPACGAEPPSFRPPQIAHVATSPVPHPTAPPNAPRAPLAANLDPRQPASAVR